jgi:hypothetical protein
MVFALVTGWLVERYSYVPVFWLFGLIPLICVSILMGFDGSSRTRFKFSEGVNLQVLV